MASEFVVGIVVTVVVTRIGPPRPAHPRGIPTFFTVVPMIVGTFEVTCRRSAAQKDRRRDQRAVPVAGTHVINPQMCVCVSVCVSVCVCVACAMTMTRMMKMTTGALARPLAAEIGIDVDVMQHQC